MTMTIDVKISYETEDPMSFSMIYTVSEWATWHIPVSGPKPDRIKPTHMN